jgi:hypothetical protein
LAWPFLRLVEDCSDFFHGMPFSIDDAVRVGPDIDGFFVAAFHQFQRDEK